MMKRAVLLFFALTVAIATFGQHSKILVQTNYGDFKVVLYDFTPKHRALLLDAVKSGVYANALFNRVIAGFVVQGGELDDSILEREAREQVEHPKRLAPEFDDRAYHKLGALGAGRDDNPSKSSYLNQLYFVVGKPVSEADLRALEQKKGINYTPEQRAAYLSKGGQPRLDKDYTVFGEVIEGLDVLLKISQVKTESGDLPMAEVVFSMSILE